MRASETDSATSESEDEDISDDVNDQIQPTLLYRRTNSYCEDQRVCSSVHFLNSSTILGVSRQGHFEIVGIADHTRNNDSNKGCGKFLAEMKLSTADPGTYNDYDLPVHSYQDGSKFAVGLFSGDLEIFAAARLSSEKSEEVSYCPPPVHALWSSLPPVSSQCLGPRRRFLRNDEYSLQTMLALTDHEAMLQASHDTSIFRELSYWKEDRLRMYRDDHSIPISYTIRTKHPWAFREGGLAASALIAAYVDAEMDCFSLKVLDERDNKPAVFVDTSPDSHRHTKDMCFTSDFGLIAGCISKEDGYNILKSYDLRMFGKQPVKSMNLYFPYNDVSGVSASKQMILESYDCLPAVLRPFIPKDEHDDRKTPRSTIEKLTGARISSNRFVAENWRHVVIIDSSRDEVVHQVLNGMSSDGDVVSTGFSSCLDTMAWLKRDIYDAEAGDGILSIYDISKNLTEGTDTSIDSKKRHFATTNKTIPDSRLATLKPKLTDLNGLSSTPRRIAMNDDGSSIAILTYDGDYFVLSP